jgi:hypothetical protein
MRTNTKLVQDQIKAHILESMSLMDIKETIANLKGYDNVYTDYQAIAKMVDGGTFLFYHSDVKDFLNNLGINPDNKEYSNEKSWNLYKHLIALNGEKLLKFKK